MDYGHLLLVLLFGLTVLHLVTLKLCSVQLDHKTTPLFISLWTLAGLAVTYPVYGRLFWQGMQDFSGAPWLLGLAVIKGAVLCYLFVISQELMRVSLSSRHYVTPMAIGLLTVCNSFLGEKLAPHELFAGLGLCALACAFFFKGHLAELDKRGRMAYAQLVLCSALLGTMDQVILSGTNWYALLTVTYLVVLVVAAFWNRKSPGNFKVAVAHRSAVIAGVVYAATELVKFYQQVTINPVTVVVIVQAMTKPVILVLSALIWKERTVREQLVWGVAAFVIALPIFLPADIWSKLWTR